jgi:hypothetical protein
MLLFFSSFRRVTAIILKFSTENMYRTFIYVGLLEKLYISIIYEELLKLPEKRTQKCANDLNRYFTNESMCPLCT